MAKKAVHFRCRDRVNKCSGGRINGGEVNVEHASCMLFDIGLLCSENYENRIFYENEITFALLILFCVCNHFTHCFCSTLLEVGRQKALFNFLVLHSVCHLDMLDYVINIFACLSFFLSLLASLS